MIENARVVLLYKVDSSTATTASIFMHLYLRNQGDDAFPLSAAEVRYWLDADGRMLRANRAELNMLGYEPDEYIGRSFADFHVDRDEAADMLARLSRGDALRNETARLRCRDGGIRHVLISSSPRWDGDRLVHNRCVVLDVTERLKTDQIRALLAAVVESTEDAVITKSLDGVVLSWNAGAAAMFDSMLEELGTEVEAELRETA